MQQLIYKHYTLETKSQRWFCHNHEMQRVYAYSAIPLRWDMWSRRAVSWRLLMFVLHGGLLRCLHKQGGRKLFSKSRFCNALSFVKYNVVRAKWGTIFQLTSIVPSSANNFLYEQSPTRTHSVSLLHAAQAGLKQEFRNAVIYLQMNITHVQNTRRTYLQHPKYSHHTPFTVAITINT